MPSARPDYLIPKPFDPRVLLVGGSGGGRRAAMESGVARCRTSMTYRDDLAPPVSRRQD